MTQAIAFINPKISTTNVGDFFIEDSVKRLIDYDSERSIDIDPRKPLKPGDIERINRCDAAVIVGTNLWYRSIAKPNRWMITADELKKIKVPFVPVGVGATLHRGESDQFDTASAALLKQIHSQCAEGSVRDPQTWEMLTKAGIDNVRMTGCPTLFRTLKPHWQLRKKPSRDVVVTVRKGQDANIRIILDELRRRNKRPVIAAQKARDLYCARRRFFSPTTGTRSLYEFNLAPYQKLVDDSYGAIGWRLHGNMFHLAHGNPAVFFANCSRVRSFTEAFSLPCIYAEDGEKVPEKDLRLSVEQLLAADIFSGFPARYAEIYQEMRVFFEKNNLAHNLQKA